MSDTSSSQTDPQAASSGTPLDAVVFERLMDRFGPFEHAPRVAVAVSGGADSMALAILADEWCRARGGQVLALTVDHGLRPDSRPEAQWVGQQLSAAGIEHQILDWMGQKPTAAVQERARNARYRLLDDALMQNGIFHLLVAHHGDDQKETIAMRATRGSGPLGMAGMSARRFLSFGRLIRPLLPVRKVDLVATLQHRGIAWVEDPSNRNPKFERVRFRMDMAQTDNASGLAVMPTKPDAVGGRQRVEQGVGQLLARAVTLHDCAIAQIDATEILDEFRRAEGRETAVYALGQAVRTIGGDQYMPAFDSLASALDRFAQAGNARMSLGGCMLHGRQGGILIYREVGRQGQTLQPLRTLAQKASSPSYTVFRWDGRFDLSIDHGQCGPVVDGLYVGPLGLCDAFHTKVFRTALKASGPFVRNLPRAALASMPALYDKDGLLSLGGLEVSGLSGVLSAADCRLSPVRAEIAFGARWRFAPGTPLWESGYKSS
ncbi:tRNA lysidine(34) synthetase TilS [Thalassospira sp. MA62]|nr:tRNA lysidine(34) synthetase TilS [Thalassospira sp. MA62]